MNDRQQASRGPTGPPTPGKACSPTADPPGERLLFPNRVQGQPTGLPRDYDEETHFLRDRETLD